MSDPAAYEDRQIAAVAAIDVVNEGVATRDPVGTCSARCAIVDDLVLIGGRLGIGRRVGGRTDPDHVRAGATAGQVVAEATDQDVNAPVTDQGVVTVTAPELVGTEAGTADRDGHEVIVADPSAETVGAVAASPRVPTIVAASAVDATAIQSADASVSDPAIVRFFSTAYTSLAWLELHSLEPRGKG